MRKIIYNKFDKKSIAQLPTVTFPGKTVVVMSESEAEKAVDFLLSRDILGVDTETRPSFKKGESHMVSLLRLLENKVVPMVGLSLHDDMLSLHKRVAFTPGFFIDLQDLVGELGIEDLSLQKLYANLFHQKISKRQRLTNWDSDVLNDKQKAYAALDAWACINLYKEILRLKQSGDYELVINEQD